MSACWIGLGANIGDARSAFDAAWSHLCDHPQIEPHIRSSLYQTTPVGANAGQAFLNAVCGLHTTLPPPELLGVLQSIELQLGRTRTVHWGPRTLDLDLLFVDQQIIVEPHLIVPHPAAWHRRFVLDPMVEVVPNLWHPQFQMTLRDLLDNLRRRPLVIGYGVETAPFIERLRQSIGSKFPEVRLDLMPLGITMPALRLTVGTNSDSSERWIPLSEFSVTSSEPNQTMIDFLTALLDEPVVVDTW